MHSLVAFGVYLLDWLSETVERVVELMVVELLRGALILQGARLNVGHVEILLLNRSYCALIRLLDSYFRVFRRFLRGLHPFRVWALGLHRCSSLVL